MPNFYSRKLNDHNDHQADSLNPEEMSFQDDMLMEQILDNMNNTPIGQVLKRITALPEIRQEKVLDVRMRISQGQYDDLNERLDLALEKVLEDLGS